MTGKTNLEPSVQVQLQYKRSFACAIPHVHCFKIEFDKKCILEHNSFHKDAGCFLDTEIGMHILGIQNINKLSRFKGKNKKHEVELPKSGKYVIELGFNSALGRWKDPIVTPLDTSSSFEEFPST